MINWRWYLFWLKDFLSGSEIYKAYKELENGCNENYNNKIEKLLSFSKENTGFYRNINGNNLKDFPVINKIMIKDNFEKFRVKQFKELHKMSTSGSTGIPFVIFQNNEKRKRVIAELIYYNKMCGYKFGEKQVFFRVWTEKNKKNKLQCFIQNLIPEDISNLEEDNLKKISESLKKNKKISNILSYASTLDKLSDYMVKNNYKHSDFSIKSIISGAEVLQEKTRNNLKRIFNCNIVSRYSNQENGVLAQECIEYNEMHLNDTNYFIEFLKLDSDEEAEEGEIARVVITDLYNYAMPLIRYDTGDLAVYSNNSRCGKKGRVITEIYGRKMDLVYDTKGNALSPHAISINMWGIEGIKQFKFQQLSLNKYMILLNSEQNKDVEEALKKKFIKILGEDAVIEVNYVDELPVLSSGKRKYIENLMKS